MLFLVYVLYNVFHAHNEQRYGWWKDIGLSKLTIPPPLPPETKVSVFGRTSANIPFGRFITAPVSVLWRPILKFSPHLADYSSKNQFPRKSSRTRECRGHVIFLHEYMVEETNPVFFLLFFFPLLRSTGSAAQKKKFEKRIFRKEKEEEIFAIRVRKIILASAWSSLGTKRSSVISERIGNDLRVCKSFPGGGDFCDGQATNRVIECEQRERERERK